MAATNVDNPEIELLKSELSAAMRQLQIEGALDRIRTQALAMRSSEDIISVARALKHELKGLGIDRVLACSIYTKIEGGKYRSTEIAGLGEDESVDVPASFVFEPADVHPDLHIHDLLKTERYRVIFLDQKAVHLAMSEASKYDPDYAEEWLEHMEAGSVKEIWTAIHPMQAGHLCFDFDVVPPPVLEELLPRLAGAFDLVLTRFLDLEKAESQAREALIEAALERVRSRALAMHSSDELQEVSLELRHQMGLLGQQELEVCAIHLYDDDPDTFGTWGALRAPHSDGEVITGVSRFPRKGVRVLEKCLEAYASDESDYVVLNQGEEALEFFGMMSQVDPKAYAVISQTLKDIPSEKLLAYWSFSDFSGGSLTMVTYQEPDPNSRKLLRRCANVFDLAYRRFLDLKEAEESAREAQIEVALERVRSRAMAMHQSSELESVVGTIMRELTFLDMDLPRCILWVVDEPSEMIHWWLANPEAEGTSVSYEMPFNDLPNTQFHLDAWRKRTPQTSYIHTGQLKVEFDDYIFSETGMKRLPAMAQEGMRAPDTVHLYSSIGDYGLLFAPSLEPISEESHAILHRFGQVFQQSYTRFLDVQRAESQAKEAQVEAALERVRSRTMAMRKSNELKDVIGAIFSELTHLDLELAHCIMWIVDEDSGKVEWLHADPNIEGTSSSYEMPFNDHPATLFHLDAWRSRIPQTIHVLDGDVKAAYDEYLFGETELKNMPAPAREGMRGLETIRLYSAIEEFGLLFAASPMPVSDENHQIVGRFAKVFQQSFTRFKDVQLAEEAARESQIEAALERVRAKAMGMRNSDELLDVVATIHQQFSGLGLECGVFWHAKYTPEYYEKALTSADGSKVSTLIILPRDFSAVPELAVWERGTEPLAVFKFDAEAGGRYMEHMISKGHLLEVDPNGVTPDMVRDHGGLTFVQARTSSGEIGYSLWGETEPEAEAKEVLLRLARVFNLAFRRYEDLKEAEEAGREAQINLAVEKVRARAMAMHRSEEMAEVAETLRNELQGLGVEGVSSSTVYTEQDEGRYRIWDMADIQGVEDSAVSLDFIFDPSEASGELYFNEIRTSNGYSSFHYSEARLKAISTWLRDHDPASADTMDRLIADKDLTDLWISSHRVQRGYLSVDTVVPPSPELEVILPKMASAFDLAYRRFEDLKEAEAATREARIEAGLERLRSRTMAMNSSDELLDVSSLMTQQLVTLGLYIHWAYVFLYNEEQDQLESYLTKSTIHPVPQAAGKFGLWTYPRQYHDPDKKQSEFLKAWKQRDATREANWEKERFDEWADQFQMMFDELGYSREDYRPHAPNGIFNAEALMGPGYVGMGGPRGFNESEVHILARFAKEFEGTYKRFQDIQKAEARTREANIEASLERVRGRAMAMQKPEDLGDVSVLMFDELSGLGINSLRSGITLPLDDARYEFRAATKSEDGSTRLVVGNESINVHPIIRRAYDGYIKQEEYQLSVLEGDDLVEYYHAVFDTMPLPDWQERMKTGSEAREVFATFPFADGWLYTFSRDDYSAEHISIFVRFTKVFGLAYQRYHDLTKAEHDYNALLAEKARTEKALSTLQATQKQLIEQEKLASLGALTAGIAHEIKNPLNFVNNFAEVSVEMAEELRDAIIAGRSEEAVELIRELKDNSAQIAKHGKRADSIVKSMMQHARGGSSDLETIQVNHFLEEYSNLAWHGMRARDHGFQAELVRKFDPLAGSITVMPQELGRVVLNLLNNAFDAIKTQKDGVVTVRTLKQDNELVISVSDNGPGIPEDIRDKIFEPFFTTKVTGEGTGLGLSLSYDIITKGHNGTMTVGTALEGGALFTITLPNHP